ncbi:unnamed protein product, partial [marine sediment metagenome]
SKAPWWAAVSIPLASPLTIVTPFLARALASLLVTNLQMIFNPPFLLYLKGEAKKKDIDALAIVGTRRATTYGKLVTRRLARALARKGVTIVSGLARGIDTAAHQGALEVGGRTIAVLGSGI